MDERSTDERLARLEERLSRLEQRLGYSEAPSPPSNWTPAVPSQRADVQPPASVTSPPPPPEPEPRRTLPPHLQPPPLPMSKPAPSTRVQPVPAASLAPLPVSGRPQTRGADTFEAQVGLKWAGWVGAIIVVIGAALGIKYAYDQQWFGTLPAAARLALMSLGGFALLAAGELVYRRVGALASAGLFGAGVATLFVVAYAGHHFLDVYDRDVAFAFMALVTFVGAAVAIRGNLVSIATLSIVGGGIAPLALGGDNARLVPLLAYLLMLQVLALVLAWWGREPKWWTLRGVALATLCLWMVVPVFNVNDIPGQPRGTLIAFLLLYAALFHLELVLTSRRGMKPSTTRERAFAVPVPLGGRDDTPEQTAIGVTFSLIVTTALTIGLLVLLRDRPDWIRAAWTTGLAACCLGLGALLPRLVRGRDPLAPPSPLLALSVGYRIQAAALVVVTVPVALSGVWISVGWAVLALALAVAGAALNLSVSRAAAVFVWMLAAIHLALGTLGASIGPAAGPWPLTPWGMVLGQPIPAYFVIAALLALVAHAVAALIREDWTAASAARQAPQADRPGPSGTEDARAETSADGSLNLNYESRTFAPPRPRSGAGFQSLASVADVMAVIVFVLAACAALPSIGLTSALLGYGWVLVGLGYVIRSSELHPLGLTLVLAAAGKWLVYDTLAASAVFGGTRALTYRPVYNPVAAVGAALLASAVALRMVPLHLTRRLKLHRAPGYPDLAPVGQVALVRAAAGFVAVLVGLWLVTAEVDRYFEARAAVADSVQRAEAFLRTKQVTISIVWSVYAVACVAAGFAARAAGLRYFGLALFALTVGKVMLVDLASLETGYRILSFLGLGLLLLGTSVLYGKLSPLLLGEPDPPPPQTPPPDNVAPAEPAASDSR